MNICQIPVHWIVKTNRSRIQDWVQIGYELRIKKVVMWQNEVTIGEWQMEQCCDTWTLFQMNLCCDNLTMAMNAPLLTPATKINVFCSGGSNCVGHLYNSIMCPRSYKRCLVPPVTILTIEINCGAAFSSQISTLGAGSGDTWTWQWMWGWQTNRSRIL